MQLFGNISKSYTWTTYAIQTLISLGYHTITSSAVNTEQDEAIQASLMWCHLFDKSMSTLLQRPQMLPKLQLPLASLLHSDPSSGMTQFVLVLLSISEVQEAVLNLHPTIHARNQTALTASINSIRSKMTSIQASLDIVRVLHYTKISLIPTNGLTGVFEWGSSLSRTHPNIFARFHVQCRLDVSFEIESNGNGFPRHKS